MMTDRKRRWIFVCLIISGIASSILSTAMTTALPDLVRYFHVSTGIGQWVTSGYSLAMGIVMPLLTWGTNSIHIKKVADASSLLTSLRTVAGAIRSAVFVGIMTAVSEGSAASYGERALMHGMNVAFLCMAAGSVILLLTAVCGVVTRDQ